MAWLAGYVAGWGPVWDLLLATPFDEYYHVRSQRLQTLITDDTALARTRPLKSQNRILHSHTRPKSSSSESNI